MIDYNILGTGSTGNAVIINKNILIDCGLPYVKIKSYIKDIKLVLLTHQHIDHFKPATIKALYNERPSLRFACCHWMVKSLVNAGVDRRVIDVFDIDITYSYWGLCSLKPVELVHNVPNCGYIIETDNGNMFYATDTGTLDHLHLPNLSLYMIEANHSQKEIADRIKQKQEKGEFAYEWSAAKNHLSEEQALNWLVNNAGENSKYVFLHQHKTGRQND